MGSETLTNTIGIVLVSRITAAVAGVARVRMASRRSATSSLCRCGLVGRPTETDLEVAALFSSKRDQHANPEHALALLRPTVDIATQHRRMSSVLSCSTAAQARAR